MPGRGCERGRAGLAGGRAAKCDGSQGKVRRPSLAVTRLRLQRTESPMRSSRVRRTVVIAVGERWWPSGRGEPQRWWGCGWVGSTGFVESKGSGGARGWPRAGQFLTCQAGFVTEKARQPDLRGLSSPKRRPKKYLRKTAQTSQGGQVHTSPSVMRKLERSRLVFVHQLSKKLGTEVP